MVGQVRLAFEVAAFVETAVPGAQHCSAVAGFDLSLCKESAWPEYPGRGRLASSVLDSVSAIVLVDTRSSLQAVARSA